MAKEKVTMKKLDFGPRRGVYIDIAPEIGKFEIPESTIRMYEDYDLVYRTLCGILYNFVPTSGHPGGSISSGRAVAGILFHVLDYDIGDPETPDADVISYAAGHKAMGLYAMWALRNEVARIGKASLLPKDAKLQLRFEDLLGFRRNPTQETPLFAKYDVHLLLSSYAQAPSRFYVAGLFYPPREREDEHAHLHHQEHRRHRAAEQG